jgi:hypothetical protein
VLSSLHRCVYYNTLRISVYYIKILLISELPYTRVIVIATESMALPPSAYQDEEEDAAVTTISHGVGKMEVISTGSD